MSFGISTGDFIAVGNLAWKTYKSCRDAPESFINISVEVLSLHAVLKEVEETLSEHELSKSKEQNLATISHGCECVLKDLQALVARYESLGSQSRRTWDRMKWGANDIAELRARLTSNTVMLTAFMSTSQVVVERKLNKLIQEFQDGKHEGSILTVATVESLNLDEKQMWRTIRKELEDIGISVAAFDANKSFILEWFQQAIETGAFEELQLQHTNEDSESIQSRDDQYSDPMSINRYTEEYDTDTEPAVSVSPVSAIGDDNNAQKPLPLRNREEASEFTPIIPPISENSPRSPQQKVISKPHIPSRKQPRVVSLISWALRYNKAFWKACENADFRLAELLLKRGADIETKVDGETALMRASLNGEKVVAKWLLNRNANPETCNSNGDPALLLLAKARKLDMLLMLVEKTTDIDIQNRAGETVLRELCWGNYVDIVEKLLAKGADPTIELVEGSFSDFAPLHIAAYQNSVPMLNLLLDQGIDIDVQSRILKITPWMIALRNENGEEVVRFLLERGANTEVRNHQNLTPLQMAVNRNGVADVKALLEYGADIHPVVAANKGNTYSILELSDEMVHILRRVEGLHLSKTYMSGERWTIWKNHMETKRSPST